MTHTGFVVTWTDEDGKEHSKRFTGQPQIMNSLLRQAHEFQRALVADGANGVYLMATGYSEEARR